MHGTSSRVGKGSLLVGSVLSSSLVHPPKPAHTGSCEFANPSGNTTGSTNYVIAPVSHGPPFTISFWVLSPLAYKSAVIGLKSSTGTEKAMQIVLGATATGVVIAQTTYTAGAWSDF